MKLNATHKRILSEIIEECNKNKITFILSHKKRVKLPEENDDAAANGFFADGDRILAVAAGNPVKQWFWVLLHEYNHMKQWKEKVFFTKEGAESEELFWGWLFEGQKLPKEKLNEVVEMQRECEYDCEERTIKMLEDNPEIGIDPVYYTQKVNSYLYFYTMVKRRRKWYKKAPYEVEEIVNIMPKKLLKDYNRVPKKYSDLVDKHCF